MQVIAPWLSQKSEVGENCSNASSFASDRYHRIVFAAWVDAIYLASQDERATMTCCFDDHAMGPPPSSIKYLHTDLRCSLCAQSESVNALNMGYGLSRLP